MLKTHVMTQKGKKRASINQSACPSLRRLPYIQMPFVHACVRVNMALRSSPPPVPVSGWTPALVGAGGVAGGRRGGGGRGAQGGGCEGILQSVPSFTGSLAPAAAPCDMITWPPAGSRALMLPGPVNKFAFLSSEGKQPHLWEGRAQANGVANVCMMHEAPAGRRGERKPWFTVSEGATQDYFPVSIIAIYSLLVFCVFCLCLRCVLGTIVSLCFSWTDASSYSELCYWSCPSCLLFHGLWTCLCFCDVTLTSQLTREWREIQFDVRGMNTNIAFLSLDAAKSSTRAL